MKTFLDLLGWNPTAPLIVFNNEPESGTPNSGTSGAKEYNSSGTVTSSPKPKAKPKEYETTTEKATAANAAKENETLTQKVKNEFSDAATDIKMGVKSFGKSYEEAAKDLAAAGYTPNQIKDYQDRTKANIQAQKEEQAKLEAMREQGRSDEQPEKPKPSIINTGGTTTSGTNTAVPLPVVPGSPEDTSGPGAAEIAVEEEAKKKKGYAGTVETTPSGLMTEAKTTKKKSLMGGLIS